MIPGGQQDQRHALLSQGTGYLQNFTADNGNSKQGKLSDYLICEESYVSFKSYTSLMNSFKLIHCFLPKQSKRSLSFTCNSFFKYVNVEMVIHSQLAKVRPSSVKIWRTQVPWDRSAYFSSS